MPDERKRKNYKNLDLHSIETKKLRKIFQNLTQLQRYQINTWIIFIVKYSGPFLARKNNFENRIKK